MADESTGIGYFPPEILMEILKRLPSKSLCRFRCVSQRWLSLIFDPTFVSLHRNSSESRPMLLLATAPFDAIFGRIPPVLSLSLHSHASAESSSPIQLPYNVMGRRLLRVRPVAGLVCHNLHDRILICNPGTREQVTVPYPVAAKLITQGRTTPTERWASLCFNPVDNIHKILCLCDNSNYVLSWGTGRWRRIQDTPNSRMCRQDTDGRDEICIDGILYYTVCRRPNLVEWEMSGRFVAKFHVHSEKIEISPVYISTAEVTNGPFVEYLGKRLAVLGFPWDKYGIQLRVLQEAGWSAEEMVELPSGRPLLPAGSVHGGEHLVFRTSNHFPEPFCLIYNVKTKEFVKAQHTTLHRLLGSRDRLIRLYLTDYFENMLPLDGFMIATKRFMYFL